MMRSLGRRPSDQELAEAVAGVMGSCTLTLLPHPAHTLRSHTTDFTLLSTALTLRSYTTALLHYCALTLLHSHLAVAQGWRRAWT